MFRRLDPERRERFLRAVHQHLNAPEAASERRWRELGFLATLLDEVPQPPETLPYIERHVYEKRRPTEAPEAPRAAWLCERYGSWKRACYAAWGLLDDGSRRWGSYEPRLPPGHKRVTRYTTDECIRTVEECAKALGSIPSSWDFHRWTLARRRRAKAAGMPIRLAGYNAVLRQLAPERTHRDGWTIVVEKVFGRSTRR
jgi:hypothetical protein